MEQTDAHGRAVSSDGRVAASGSGAASGGGGHRCMGGSVVEFSPATREARVRFPAHATPASPLVPHCSPRAELGLPAERRSRQRTATAGCYLTPAASPTQLPTTPPAPTHGPAAKPPWPQALRARPPARPHTSLVVAGFLTRTQTLAQGLRWKEYPTSGSRRPHLFSFPNVCLQAPWLSLPTLRESITLRLHSQEQGSCHTWQGYLPFPWRVPGASSCRRSS